VFATCAAFIAIVLIVALFRLLRRCAAARPPRRRRRAGAGTSRVALTPPKPAWVRREIVRLKAMLPDHGCRKIAQVFNQLHQRRGETVGKTFVANVLRDREHDVLRLRLRLKHRRPRTVPRNLLWALDLTSLPDSRGPRTVLGLIDHGSRACLALRELRTRSAITLLRALLDAIERYGRPRILLTDNEAAFASRLFRDALRLLGIRHWRTAPHAPWQNGRVERFFATFKDRVLRWFDQAGVPHDLAPDLALFRAWYNHARPHQHLDGLTPALAWAGKQPAGEPRYVSEWNGLLSGLLWPA
jgi:transposase InsO family protein